MAEQFLSEIRLMCIDFAPQGWALCDGQILSIAQNQALFALLGTNYGGDGRSTFALPDLRGRVPVHIEGHGPADIGLGTRGGSEAVTLSRAQVAAHHHGLRHTVAAGNANDPSGAALPAAPETNAYAPTGPLVPLDPRAVGEGGGGGQAHTNMQPSLVLSYCIAIQGIFPSP